MSTLDFLTSPFGLPIVVAGIILFLPCVLPRRSRKRQGLRPDT